MSRDSVISSGQYAWDSTRHYWRVNCAIVLGILVGTSVLTGALIVGDSVRHSLQKLTLERLGKIDLVLFADHFFAPAIIDDAISPESPIGQLDRATSVVMVPQATAERTSDSPRRSGSVTVLGTGEDFWSLSTAGRKPRKHPTGREVVLNQPLADELDAEIGDIIVIRLQKVSQVAGDSPLGEKTDRVRSLAELEVIDIVPAEGLGRFSLQANQALPRTAFVDQETVQRALDQEGRVNAILFSGSQPQVAPSPSEVSSLQDRIRPTLDDAGLQLRKIELTYFDEAQEITTTSFEYLSLSTDAMMFSPQAESSLQDALSSFDFEPVLTYLANDIQRLSNGETTDSIPYSTVSAVGSGPLSPLAQPDGTTLSPLADDEIIINAWAAEDSQAKIGDRIRLGFFAPETTHGEVETRTSDFRLKAIAPLTKPLLPFTRRQPARYVAAPQRTNDPDLTPTVEGVTDQQSIAEWDPPFPFDYSRIRQPQDDDYWDEYRTTPKAFISLSAGQRLWGSRFGKLTSFRIGIDDSQTEAQVRASLTAAIQSDLGAFGFQWLPVKQQGLLASKGTTPFNALFLGFSSFIIASAVMLVTLLLRLGLEQRADESGLLLAAGFAQRRLFTLRSLEGSILIIGGVVLGTLVGISYAHLMILGLRTWWLDAVVTPFLQVHIQPSTLLTGAMMSAVACYMTIRWTVWKFTKIPICQLLAGQTEALNPQRESSKRLAIGVKACLGLVIICSMLAMFLRGEAQAGAFFGSGAFALAAMLMRVSIWFAQPRNRHMNDDFATHTLVAKNIARHPSRSVLTIGLVATASFLIVAISAFRLTPTEQGTGGFNLLGTSDIALFEDIDKPAIQHNLLSNQASKLAGSEIESLRFVAGDDASCRNLYQAQHPQLIGITPRFVSRFDDPETPNFGWAATAAQMPQDHKNPWRLLAENDGETVPVVLDKNTAMYSLHLYRGIGEEFEIEYPSAGTIRFRVIGLLANSVLQGSLLVSEQHLLQQFPDVSGYRFFLIKCEPQHIDAVKTTLQNAFSDQGLILTNTVSLLRNLLAVQNTYLSTFQSLGGLGLLLGTLGLVAVQMRSIFERRREFSLMRAMGFSRRQLGQMTLMEHVLLLLSGLLIGIFAALIAVLPQAWSTDVRPPWPTVMSLLIVIMGVGVVTGLAAMRPVVKAPLAGALRDN